MTMRTARCVVVLLSTVALAGCVTNYQYLAHGQVAVAGNSSQSAVIYWNKDEGRLWYGAQHEQASTDVTLRICSGVPKPFHLGPSKHLVLEGRPGDRRAAELAQGTVVPLSKPEPVGKEDECGLVLLDGSPTDTARLIVGTRPAIAILCDNAARPDRYPLIGIYPFGVVSRSESDKKRTGPDPCRGP